MKHFVSVCVCVCATPLSRHICLDLISFAWHRDAAFSLVFNNTLDSGHLSRSDSEYSSRIEPSFGQNNFKVIIFLFILGNSLQICSHFLCWNTNPLLRICWFPFSHLLSFPPPFLSSHFSFFVRHCINLSCHVSDPNFQAVECFQGSYFDLSSPALFDQSLRGEKYPRQRDRGPDSLSPQSESVSSPRVQADPLLKASSSFKVPPSSCLLTASGQEVFAGEPI